MPALTPSTMKTCLPLVSPHAGAPHDDAAHIPAAEQPFGGQLELGPNLGWTDVVEIPSHQARRRDAAELDVLGLVPLAQVARDAPAQVLLPELARGDDAPLGREVRGGRAVRQKRRRGEDARLEDAGDGEGRVELAGELLDKRVDAVAGDEHAVVLVELAAVDEVPDHDVGAQPDVVVAVDARRALGRRRGIACIALSMPLVMSSEEFGLITRILMFRRSTRVVMITILDGNKVLSV
ncbi:hypothetical protein ColKHC_07655 [Colletotrichum higginsianum]|nr:hypothetical protein ColKHC_07655 [Colletotrichum higginsianum]